MNTQLLSIFANGKKATHSKGSVIMDADEMRVDMFFIVSGWVKIVQNNNYASEKILTTLQQGDIFPFEWTAKCSQTTSFVALEETKTLSIPLATFKEKVVSSPCYAEEVMTAMTRQYESLIHEITNLQYRSAREKLILRLLSLAEDFGQREDGLIMIKKNISNEYMAKSTSMSRETTSREISKLIRERLIRHSSQGIVLLDVDTLYRQVSKTNAITSYMPNNYEASQQTLKAVA